ncbi:MAG: hypothetical protein HUJ51_04120 [Eggerthellaceae bacterium]|nr:hypothetical protein [Eggerthellaceae bacterium]
MPYFHISGMIGFAHQGHAQLVAAHVFGCMIQRIRASPTAWWPSTIIENHLEYWLLFITASKHCWTSVLPAIIARLALLSYAHE